MKNKIPSPLMIPGVAARLNELTLKRNVPVAVTLELTRRCPLSCAHCYLPETRSRARARAEKELTAAQWKDILRQLADAGTVYLVFTGGEPLLRPDLASLCRFARKLNFDVRIFSSGLGLEHACAEELAESGVSGFELSLYGRRKVHEAATGMPGSFDGTVATVRLLRALGVAVKIKTPLMRTNVGEIPWLLEFGRRNGCGNSFDPVLAPGNDRDRSNLGLRLGGRELRALARKHPAFFSSPLTETERTAFPGLLCGAGRNVAAIDPYGQLSPCLQLPVPLGNLLETPFSVLWRSSPYLKKLRRAGLGAKSECGTCGRSVFCNRCPGISYLEKGDLLAPNAPACELAAVMSALTRSRCYPGPLSRTVSAARR